MKKNKNNSIEEFICFLLTKYNISFKSISDCIKQKSDEFKNIARIFDLSSPREKELCLTLLTMISVKYSRSIIFEYCKENNLDYKLINIDDSINNNKSLIATALIYNTSFANIAFLLCSYMGREVLDKAAEYILQVRRDRSAIRNVPEEYQFDHPDICLAAVKYSGRALEDVKIKNFEICFAAVKKYAWALEYIKDTLCDFETRQIYEICKEAVTGRGLTLEYVFQNNKNKFDFSEEQIKTICMTAIKNNGLALEYIPVDLRKNDSICRELYMEAVSENSAAINFVPPDALCYKEVEAVAIERHKKEKSIKYTYIDEFAEYYEDDEQKKTFIDCYPRMEETQNRFVIFTGLGKRNYPVTIRKGSMKNENIQKIYIPKIVEEIEEEAFLGNSISEIYFERIPKMRENSFPSGIINSLPENYKNEEPGKGKIIKCTPNAWSISDKPEELIRAVS